MKYYYYYICLDKKHPTKYYGEVFRSDSLFTCCRAIPEREYLDMKSMSVSQRLNTYGARLGLEKKTFYYIKTGGGGKPKGSLISIEKYTPYEDGDSFEGWANIDKEFYGRLKSIKTNDIRFKFYQLYLNIREHQKSRQEPYRAFDTTQIFTGKCENASPIDFNRKYPILTMPEKLESFREQLKAVYRVPSSYLEGAWCREDKIQFEINPQSEKNMFNNLTIKTNEATVNGVVIKTEAKVYDTISKVSEDLEQYKELGEKVESEHVKSKIVQLESELESLAKVLDSFNNKGKTERLKECINESRKQYWELYDKATKNNTLL